MSKEELNVLEALQKSIQALDNKVDQVERQRMPGWMKLLMAIVPGLAAAIVVGGIHTLTSLAVLEDNSIATKKHIGSRGIHLDAEDTRNMTRVEMMEFYREQIKPDLQESLGHLAKSQDRIITWMLEKDKKGD